MRLVSLRWQLFAAVAVLTTAVQVAAGWIAGERQSHSEYQLLDSHADGVAGEIAIALRDPLYNLDVDLAATLLTTKLRADRSIDGVVARDTGDGEKVLAARVRGRDGEPAATGSLDGLTPWKTLRRQISRDGEAVATLELAINDRVVRQRLADAASERVWSIVLTEAVLLLGLAGLLQWLVVRPLRRTAAFAAEVRDGHLDERLDLGGHNEIGVLSRSLNEMAEGLQRSRAELEAKRAAAEQAARAKSDFLSVMSHELRTPLNGVIGMSELLRASDHSPEQRESIEVIQQCGANLLTLIDDILDYAKIEAGRLELERIPVDIRRLIEDSAVLVSSRAFAKELDLIALADASVPARVVADPVRLRQVVGNLLANAVKFTEHGSVILRATSAGGRLLVSVTDTGIGIDPAAQGRLFQPFMQADQTTTRRFGGTGLGLAISRRLTQLMGGDIRLESAAGRGSTFTIDVPMTAAMAAEADHPLAGRRALVWGGSTISAQANRAQLTALGALVIPDGDESLDSAAARCDLALIDLGGDRTGGIDLLARLRAGRGGDLPIALAIRPTERAALPDPLEAKVVAKPVRGAALVHAFTGGTGRIARDTPTPLASLSLANHPLVLVVEDDPVNRLVVVRLLAALGCRVTTASDGLHALDHAGHPDSGVTREPPAVVLMDLQMPVMDGIECIRRWREIESQAGTRRVPIIVLTADVLSQARADALSIGADEILAKPIEAHALAKALRRHIR